MRLIRLLAAVGLCLAAVVLAVLVPRSDHRTWSAPHVTAPGPTGVAGYLYADLDRDRRHDADEPLLADRQVRVLGTGTLPLSTTRTRADGTFRVTGIEGLTPGVTTVRVRVAPVMTGGADRDLPPDTDLAQTFSVPLGTSAALPVASYRRCTHRSDCPALALPDLTPLLTSPEGTAEEYPAPTRTTVDTSSAPGRVLLRFASAAVNHGGLLHLVAVRPSAVERDETVVQRVYGPGVVYLHRAGRFVFHPSHHHFHLDDFERYDLLDAGGQHVLRTSGKVSFCLTDVLPAAPPAPGSSPRLELPPMQCNAVEQGLNTGFADYYGSALPDQWIDVTGLPSGRYRVRFTLDPRHQLLDADRGNDSAWFPLDYTAP